MTMDYSKYCKSIVSGFIEDPEMLKVEHNITGPDTNILIKPATQSDAARIIGKHGRNITALKTLLRAVGKTNGDNIKLVMVYDTFKKKKNEGELRG